MVNGLDLYSALKYIIYLTHSYTDGGVNHARQPPEERKPSTMQTKVQVVSGIDFPLICDVISSVKDLKICFE